MQTTIQSLKRSPSVKALAIGALILLLLIPVSMIQDVVRDRQSVHDDARFGIKQSWGHEQLIAGPVLIVPYALTHIDSKGNEIVDYGQVYLLPQSLEVNADVSAETLYRSIHEVPIYSSTLRVGGQFSTPDLDRLGIRRAALDWRNASLVLAVSDARAIAETPSVEINGSGVRFEPGGRALFDDLPPPIVAPVGTALPTSEAPLVFAFELTVNGSDTLQFTPLGDTTTVAMTSNWPDPSFLGGYLPQKRTIDSDGFEASWQISSLGRALPSQWLDRDRRESYARQSAFGVNFYLPVSLYQLTLRATKYAVLFIGLSFVAYFLFEILSTMRLHPLQYLLVGFANALFYLLLLSLAEHVGFGQAYVLSAAASTGLITAYSSSILGSVSRAAVIALILSGLYSFLYMTLKAESFALLGGSIGLWITLAVIMFMTRRIDWYSQGREALTRS